MLDLYINHYLEPEFPLTSCYEGNTFIKMSLAHSFPGCDDGSDVDNSKDIGILELSLLLKLTRMDLADGRSRLGRTWKDNQ